jgi:hypothetical protein
VGATRRTTDPARLRVPATVVVRGEVVTLEVLDAAGSTGEDDDVATATRHTDVQRSPVDVEDP